MNSVQKKRLQKLVDFLEGVPSKHFNLSVIGYDEDGCNHIDFTKNMKKIAKGEKIKCGTVGCAIGWMPVIFKDFKYIVDIRGNSCSGESYFNVINKNTNLINGKAVNEFFGLDEKETGWLFLPSNYNNESKRNVINRIKKFIKEDKISEKNINSVIEWY